MRVIVGGFGRVGRHLAHVLEERGHTVTVIDRDPAVFAEHGESVAGRKLTGEAFDRDTLLKAGIESADAFAAVTSGDNSNIVSARVAKERFGVPNVVARIFDPRRAALYERYGIPTVSSVQWAAGQLLATLLEPELRVQTVYGAGEVLTVEMIAPLGLAGKRCADIDLPGKFYVTTVCRGGEAILASSRLEITKGDRLYITTTQEALPDLKRLVGIE